MHFLIQKQQHKNTSGNFIKKAACLPNLVKVKQYMVVFFCLRWTMVAMSFMIIVESARLEYITKKLKSLS